MASPAKAFIDPSGIPARLSGVTLPSVFSLGVVIPVIGGGQMALQFGSFASNLVLTGNQPGTLIVNTVKSKIPPPPMGRQMLITFPPIYKERNANATRPQDGPIWPRVEKPTR